jgi:hypothetical protein
MGMIGRWIDDKCRREPEVMRHVLNRSFGPLKQFVTADQKCGCLVGSYGLVRGDDWAFSRTYETGDTGGAPPKGTWYSHPWRSTRRVGIHVAQLCFLKGNIGAARKRPDEFVVRLVKQRIRKSLGLAPTHTENAVAVGVSERRHDS